MKKKLFIFCFHSISDRVSAAYPVMPVKVFDKVCGLLKRNFTIIPLEEIGQPIPSNKPLAVVTFDDGFTDFYENALPILLKHRIPATQHLIIQSVLTGKSFWSQQLNDILDAYYHEAVPVDLPEVGFKGKFKTAIEVEQVCNTLFMALLKHDNPEKRVAQLEVPVAGSVSYTRMMNWVEIKECSSYGVKFGSHTYSHKNLTLLDDTALLEELTASKGVIEQMLGPGSCVSLAYPNGQYNAKVREYGIRAGFRFLLTSQPGTLSYPINPFELPRYNMYNRDYLVNAFKILYNKYCTKKCPTTLLITKSSR